MEVLFLMNKDNLQQNSDDSEENLTYCPKCKELYSYCYCNLPQISKKEINKMLDKCQSAGAMRILKKIFLKNK